MSEFRFQEADHSYWLDGQQIPGVSSIAGLSDDFSGIPREILERKTAIGKATHAGAEIINKGGAVNPFSVDPAVAGYLLAYQKFFNENVSEVIAAEQKMHCNQLRLAGQLDLVFRSKAGLKVLIDLKTVASVRATTKLQTAGYLRLYEPDFLERQKIMRSAVQLKPDGTYALHHYNSPDDERAFLGLLNFYNWSKKQ